MSETSQKQIQESDFICSAPYEIFEQINIKIIISPRLECHKKYARFETYLLFLW